MIISALKKLVRSGQTLLEIRDGIANQSDILNRKLDRVVQAFATAAALMPVARPGAMPGVGHPSTDDGASDDIPYPTVDFSAADPIPAVLAAPEYQRCVAHFSTSPAAPTALMSPDSQALLFCVMRNLRPWVAVEIGTFRTSTTEAMCRAIHANRRGVVHTIDPFGGTVVPALLDAWPAALQPLVRFHEVTSMDFFCRSVPTGFKAELVLVDGNHDYEYAIFDIEAAARVLEPGGFIFVDNIAQAGPFMAASDFLANRPDWTQCVAPMGEMLRPHDGNRTRIANTDFCVLRAPLRHTIAQRPLTIGQLAWRRGSLRGLELEIMASSAGELQAPCVIRTFGDVLTERIVNRTQTLEPTTGRVRVEFGDPVELGKDAATVEPWLTWRGDQALQLSSLTLF